MTNHFIGVLAQTLRSAGWFMQPGAYVLVDGQFGSTGKGLLASFMANVGAEFITHVTTNAGPNSGHTAYDGNKKIMTQQVPIASVFLHLMGYHPTTFINAGAVIDKHILMKEINAYGLAEWMAVSELAAVINDGNRLKDMAITDQIAGTGKGVGPALADKILRNTEAVLGSYPYWPMNVLEGMGVPQTFHSWNWNWNTDVVFVETAQGFSLGINSKFYPYTTSRECTVMQAIADARIPAQMVRKVVACFRTYPIRVGNTNKGYSGGWYPDQEEISWAELGVEPEITSVTKRVRRVFTWSRTQFREALEANRPDVIFLNFMNYLRGGSREQKFLTTVKQDYWEVMKKPWDLLLLGYGPKMNQIVGSSDNSFVRAAE